MAQSYDDILISKCLRKLNVEVKLGLHLGGRRTRLHKYGRDMLRRQTCYDIVG